MVEPKTWPTRKWNWYSKMLGRKEMIISVQI